MQGLISPDNAIRTQAEAALERQWMKKGRIDVLLVFLASQAAQGSDDTARAFAAVLFRRFAIRSPVGQGYPVTARQVDYISDGAKQAVRKFLIEGFQAPQSSGVRHKLADAIAEVSKDARYGWAELPATVGVAAGSDDRSFRECAFRILEAAPQICTGAQAEKTLGAGFADADDAVRVAACKAFVAYFEKTPRQQWPAVAGLLPRLLDSLPQLLSAGNDQALSAILEPLIELVDLAPKIFRPMFPTLVAFCAAVAKNTQLDSDARLSALELLTCFSEAAPRMCLQEQTYAPALVETCLRLTTEVCEDDDDCAQWLHSGEAAEDDGGADDEDESEECYNAARLSLDRAALKLGGQALGPPLFQYVPAMLQSSSWRDRQGALMALSSATEGCRDALITQIPKILDLITPALADSNPRVQYAACNALGQISTDFADTIQRQAAARIVPALVSMLTPEHAARVQAHAAAALVNFCEEASQEILEPYLDSLLSHLLGLLQAAPRRYVQEQVITTLAIVADAAEKKFVRYYDALMPLLMEILRAGANSAASASNQANAGNQNGAGSSGAASRLLTAKALECATLVALAVGQQKFAPDASALVQIMTQLQQSLQGDDDPLRAYLEQAWSRVCRLLGKQFLPYLPLVLPPLLSQASASQDISIVEDQDLDEVSQNDDYEVIQLEGKNIAVHTAVLDDKTAAIELLKNYADVLGADFYPYVDQIARSILIPGLDFYLHDGVRGTCAVAMPSFLRCAISAGANGSDAKSGANGASSTAAANLWNLFADGLIRQLTADPVPDLLVAYFYGLSGCLDLLGQDALSDTQLRSLAKALSSCFSDCYDRIAAKQSADADDANDQFGQSLADDDDSDYTDEELLDHTSKAVTAVFKNCHQRFVQPFHEMLLPTLSTFINDTNAQLPCFRLAGLCAASDLAEFASPACYQVRDFFFNPVGQSLSSPDATLRQCANYTVGVCAQYGGPQFAQYCIACLPSLSAHAVGAHARTEENIGATENACAAIAKVITAYGAQIDNLDSLIASWIKTLPITQDDEAAPYAYNLLARLIAQSHPAVTADIPGTFNCVAQALLSASITDKTAQNTVGAVKQMLASIPHEQALQLFEKYDPDAKLVLQRWFA